MYKLFIYIYFFFTLLSLSVLSWFINLGLSKKHKTVIDYIFLLFTVTYFLSQLISILPFLGWGKLIVDPQNMFHYIYDHPVNILYLTFGIVSIGFLNFLRIFIFKDLQQKRKWGYIIIFCYCTVSVLNLARLLKFNGLTIYELLGIGQGNWDVYFAFSFAVDIITFCIYIYIIKKSSHPNSIKLAKYLLILTLLQFVVSLAAITLVGTGSEFLDAFLQPSLFLYFSSVYVLIVFGMLYFILKYQLLSFRLISKKVVSNIILSFFCMAIYLFFFEPLFQNRNVYSPLIPSFTIAFIIFYFAIYGSGVNKIIARFLNYMFYHEEENKFKNLFELNRAILNILDFARLTKLLRDDIFKRDDINEYAFYTKKENNNYGLYFANRVAAPENISSEDPIIYELQNKGIILFEKKLLWEKIFVALPIILRNKLLGFITIGQRSTGPHLDEDDLRFFRFLCANLSICLENIYLNQKLIKTKTEVLNKENILLKSKLKRIEGAENIIGHSQALLEVLDVSIKLAGTDANILIIGENGTGKELFAKMIHAKSERARHPFVAINCAAIPENLLESELFGYKKGAFTGAATTKKGLLELADGGTIFFDEIGELPFAMQAKLLRVIQERKVVPLGGGEEISLDFRLISATNRNLEEMVENNTFRDDLYYRLNVFNIRIPSLSQRKEDIPLLINYFIQRLNKKYKKEIKGISQDAMKTLEKYEWPGNVRQLGNVLEYAVVLSGDQILELTDFPDEIIRQKTDRVLKDEALMVSDEVSKSSFLIEEKMFNYEKQLIMSGLKACQDNRVKTAKLMGITRSKLNYLLKKHGII